MHKLLTLKSTSEVKNPLGSAGDTGGLAFIPGSGRSPGGGNSNLLQHSRLEDPGDRGAWLALNLWSIGRRVRHN